MSCLEYRRLLLADPNAITDGMRGHRKRCARCRGETHRVAEMEKALRAAIAVPPPADLVAGLLADEAARPGRRARCRRAAWVAALALLALMAALFALGLAG